MALRRSMMVLDDGFTLCDYEMKNGFEKNDNRKHRIDGSDNEKLLSKEQQNDALEIRQKCCGGGGSEKRGRGNRSSCGSSCCCCYFDLVKIFETPQHLQFNGYIWDGYRPPMSAWNCIKTLTIVHNETMNILTHGIPLIYILLNANVLLPWSKITIPALPYFHIMACILPWIGSTIYHLFMALDGGERIYNILLKVDVVGIWFTQTFGALTTIYASIYCLPYNVKFFIFFTYLAISAMALYKALTAVTRWGRRFCFVLQFSLRLGLIFLRMTPLGGGDPRAFKHVILQEALPFLGGVIGALCVPERWFPGKFDYIGNSHNIMHVIVVAGIFHMHWATTLDLLWLSRGNSQCV